MAKKLTKKQLIEMLKELKNSYDREVSHAEADGLLIKYINDPEVKESFGDIEKRYS